VSEFSGKTVGIDGYCWLHKGVYGCAKDVVEGRKTTVYINYVLKRIELLLSFNVKPVMVFDGGYLPAKASKEKERRSNREESLRKAKAHLRAGQNSKANDYFQRCVEITPAMATEVIEACRGKNILCIVAPYEADAQLAYLEMQGITDFTITEDSDLLIYGCRKVLFKMNSGGDGIFINLDNLNKVRTVALESFTMEKFRHMCILSGCDYLSSIKGLGLYKAHKYLKKSTNVYKAIQLIQQEKKLTVPEGYADNFRKTDAVFKYQSVFDPRRKRIVRLNEVSEHDDVTEEELRFAGPEIDEAKAVKIALGNLDPISGKILGNFHDFQNDEKVREPQKYHQATVVNLSKPRDPNLRYSLGDTELDCEDSDAALEAKYMTRDEDSLSPPEAGLRNVHLDDKEKESSPYLPSSGILYKDKGYSRPQASGLTHHSVFVKRKRSKLKNPFRVCEDVDGEVLESQESRYFSSQGSSRGKEIGPTTDDAEKFDLESGSIKALSENFGSFPNCKRVRLSLTDNSDAESMNSQMYEDSRMQKQDVFASPNVDDSGVYKIVDRRSLSTFENQNTESTEKHSDAFISYEIGHRRQHCPKEDQESSNPVTFDCSAEPMPFLSQASSSVASIENKAGSNSLSLEKLSGRLSLFKYRKPVITNYLQKEKENQEIGACSQKKVDEETSSSLHLQKRSFSAPVLPRPSENKRSSLLGKCKTVGLSRRSKSSLERVREKDSKLKQQKIGFERFSYTKKKHISKENSADDSVICIS